MSEIFVLAEIVRQVVLSSLAHSSSKELHDMRHVSPDFERWRRKVTQKGAFYVTRCFVAGKSLTLTTELTAQPMMLGRIPPPFSKRCWWSLSEVTILDSAGNIEKCSLASLRTMAAKNFWDFLYLGLWNPNEDWSDFFGVYWSEDLHEGQIVRNPNCYSIDAEVDDCRYELIHAIPANCGEASAVDWLGVRQAAWIEKFLLH